MNNNFINKLGDLQKIIRFLTILYDELSFNFTQNEKIIIKDLLCSFNELLFDIDILDINYIDNRIEFILITNISQTDNIYNIIKNDIYHFGKHLTSIFIDYFSK
jgi:hypothetical protein